MKVRVLRRFKDRHNGKRYKVGDEVIISKARFEEILSVGPFVEAIKEPDKEPEQADSIEESDEKPSEE